MNSCKVGGRRYLIAYLIASSVFCNFPCLAQSVNWQWARGSRGVGVQEGYAVAADTRGNVFVTGFFQQADSIIFDTVTLYNGGYDNFFITKYSTSGQFLWTRSAAISGQDVIVTTGISTDAAGNVYVVGYYRGSAIRLGAIGLPAFLTGYWNIFVAKYDASGNVLWVNGAGDGGYNCTGYGIATDASGNSYITGYISGDTINFGNLTLLNNSNLSQAMFVAKYDVGGNALWATTPVVSHYTGSDWGLAIATDSQSNAYVTGLISNDSEKFGSITLSAGSGERICTVKYDSLGNVIWAAEDIGPNQAPMPHAIAVDKNENAYVTGTFTFNTITFGSVTINNGAIPAGSNGLFLIKYDASGNVSWGKGASGPGNEEGFAIAADNNFNIYLAGEFVYDYITIDSTTILAPMGYTDPLFVVTFDTAGNLICSSALGSGADDIFGLCVDPAGNAYIGSDFEMRRFIVGPDTLRLSDTTEVDDTLSLYESENIYVAKFICNTCYAGSVEGGNLNYQLSPAVLCNGDSALISFSGDSAIVISPNSRVAWLDSVHAFLYPDTTTKFTLKGYAPCGVYAVQAFTLPVVSQNVEITSNKTAICPGDSAQICAPAGLTNYTWSNHDTTACFYTSSAGTYTVTATINNNCTASSNPINISVYQPTPVTVSTSGDTLVGFGGNSFQWFLNGVAISGARSAVYIVNASGTYTVQVTDTNGCLATSSPILITGIANEPPENSIIIYPNPTTSDWQLTVSPEWLGSTARIFDATGRLVYKSPIVNSSSQITIPNAASGVYELQITSDEYSAVRKLVRL